MKNEDTPEVAEPQEPQEPQEPCGLPENIIRDYEEGLRNRAEYKAKQKNLKLIMIAMSSILMANFVDWLLLGTPVQDLPNYTYHTMTWWELMPIRMAAMIGTAILTWWLIECRKNSQ